MLFRSEHKIGKKTVRQRGTSDFIAHTERRSIDCCWHEQRLAANPSPPLLQRGSSTLTHVNRENILIWRKKKFPRAHWREWLSATLFIASIALGCSTACFSVNEPGSGGRVTTDTERKAAYEKSQLQRRNRMMAVLQPHVPGYGKTRGKLEIGRAHV